MNSGFKKLLQTLAAIAIFTVLFAIVNLQELWAVLSGLSLELFIYLMLISVILIYISSIKWQIFLESFGAKVSVIRLFHLYLLGYFVNVLVPSYLGGDAARSWYLGKKVGQRESFTSTILERYTGLFAMLTLGVVFVWFVDQVPWQARLAVVLMTVGFAAATLVALSPKTIAWLRRFSRLEPLLKNLEKIQQGLHVARSNKLLMLKTLALSYLFHTFTVVNVLFTAWAVGWWDPPLADIFVVLPIILIIGSLPISPSGLGLQEGAFVYFLHGLGASTAQALGLGIILRAKSYLLALWGGLAWLFIRRAHNRGHSS